MARESKAMTDKLVNYNHESNQITFSGNGLLPECAAALVENNRLHGLVQNYIEAQTPQGPVVTGIQLKEQTFTDEDRHAMGNFTRSANATIEKGIAQSSGMQRGGWSLG
jgi:hypothetical protein